MLTASTPATSMASRARAISSRDQRHRLLRPCHQWPHSRSAKCCDKGAPFHVWMAPAWQEIFLTHRTEVACSHVSGLLMQPE
jgi:hypothetical protein